MNYYKLAVYNKMIEISKLYLRNIDNLIKLKKDYDSKLISLHEANEKLSLLQKEGEDLNKLRICIHDIMSEANKGELNEA